MKLREQVTAVFQLLFRFYWIIAFGLFLALEWFSAYDHIRVFSFILKIPFIAGDPHLLRLSVILSDFLTGTAAAYLSFLALRLLRKKVVLASFWAALIVIMGVVSFVRPFLGKENAVWAAELLRMFLMIIALWSVYQLEWGIAFSIWALGYMVLMAPLYFAEEVPLLGKTEAMEHSSVLAEIKSLNSSVQGTAERLAARHRLQEYIKTLLVEAEKGDAQAQYALALLCAEGTSVNGEPPEQALEHAFQWMAKASSQGLVDAQVGLGNFYLQGDGIPINPSQAAQLYRAAAEKGNMDAEARLGWLYAHGLGVDWNGEEALRRYSNAVHGGSALGLWGLADMYITGNGAPRDHELGMSYFVKAAEEGCAPAMAQLGVLMLAGAGKPSETAQAIAYLHQAARAGEAEAQYLYMTILTEGVAITAQPNSVRWWGNHLSTAALIGHADSQWYWARALEDGLMGHADPHQAWPWFVQSASKGFPDALRSQGDYLAYGLAGEHDPDKALMAYQTAAQFNAQAMRDLIIRYRNGTGVHPDPAKVEYYLNQLRLYASRGDAQAEYYLGELCRNGIVIPQSYPQALTWYRRSAENGLGQAYYRIAEMYENGEGVKKDEQAAFQHYRRAASLFYFPAYYNIAARKADGIGTEKNVQESGEWVLRIQRGAQRGNPAHLLSLARLRERGLFVARDEALSAAAYQKAALRNDVDAERALAKMYREGRGVRKNLMTAYGWLDDAAHRGDGRAKRLRDALRKELPVRERDRAKSHS